MGYDGSNTTGFMSPAQDYADAVVDLRDYINLSAPNMYLSKVQGDLCFSDIKSGDVLVLDSNRPIINGDIVLMFSGGDIIYTVAKREAGLTLVKCNGLFRHLNEDEEIWAVVVSFVRKIR